MKRKYRDNNIIDNIRSIIRKNLQLSLFCIFVLICITIVVGIVHTSSRLGLDLVNEHLANSAIKPADFLSEKNPFYALSQSTVFHIGLFGVIMSGFAFLIQFLTNIMHRNDIAAERFETKLHNLSDIQRKYSEDIVVGSKRGVGVFHYLFYEYKSLCQYVVRTLHKSATINDEDIEKYNIIAFTLFIDGVCANNPCVNNPFTKNKLSKIIKSDEVDTMLVDISKFQISKQDNNCKDVPEFKYIDYTIMGKCLVPDVNGSVDLKVFDGHRSIFIPYIRIFELTLDHIYNNQQHFETNKSLEEYFSDLTILFSEHEIGLLLPLAKWRIYEMKNGLARISKSDKKLSTKLQRDIKRLDTFCEAVQLNPLLNLSFSGGNYNYNLFMREFAKNNKSN